MGGERPTDIPESVWDAALRSIHDTVAQFQSGIAINQHTLDTMILAAARAILAERERAAKVVLSRPDPYGLLAEIAAAIRGGA